MAFTGYEYTIEGESYVDIGTAADALGVSLGSLRNLMRGIELGRNYDFPFIRKGRKVFFKKDNLKLLKGKFGK